MVVNILCFVLGFLVSLLVLKRGLNKEGAGNCKMCRDCRYKRFSESVGTKEYLKSLNDKGGVKHEV